MKPVLLAAVLALTLTACEQPEFTPDTRGPETYRPDTPGSHEMLCAPIEASDGLEVLISDVVIPANGTVPLHYHPGEEFLYIIEGSALHREDGQADRELKAGDSYVIPPMAKHSPIGGPEGARAIVFRVHLKDQPERILVED